MGEFTAKINNIINFKFTKRWHYLTAAFLILIIILAGAIMIFEIWYYGRIFPGIRAAEINLSGDIKEMAERKIKDEAYKIKKQPLIFSANKQTASIDMLKTDKKIIDFRIKEAVNEAYITGRGKNYLTNFSEQLQALFFGYQIMLRLVLDKNELKEILKEEFAELDQPAKNAQLKIENNEVVGIIPEEKGRTLNYEEALNDLERQLQEFKNPQTIKLTLTEDLPTITQDEAGRFVETLSEILALAPIELAYEEKTWEIDEKTLASWLELQTWEGEERVGLNKEKTLEFLENIAAEIDRPAQNAEFEMKEKKISKFIPHLNGIKLNLEKSYEIFNTLLPNEREKEITLIAETDEPEIKLSELNDLGINKLIGTGITDFSGSPWNRRQNIARGAELLQWKLIEPDEEFSTLEALKPFTLSNGYYSELVIKGNRTTPEVGGGLCQVGTTMFRVVLDSGLPVTERRNHSYRVSYYEPPIGMDATIYDPTPDFKFLNDTEAHLLLTTEVRGNELIFELWGTDDGRIATTTDPVVYNFVGAPPQKTIETTDLEPGKIRCTEHAHAGSDAKFTYTVTYADGTIKEEDFISHYVPWQKVCLLGVEQLSEPEGDEIDTNEETKTDEDEAPVGESNQDEL